MWGHVEVLLRSCVVVFVSRVHVGVSVLGCHDSFGRSAYFDMLTFLPCVYRSEGRYVWWSLDVEVILRSCMASLVVPCLGFAGCGCLCHFSGECGLVLCCTRPRGVCGAVGSGPFPPSGVCVRCGCGIGPACWYVEEAVYCLD